MIVCRQVAGNTHIAPGNNCTAICFDFFFFGGKSRAIAGKLQKRVNAYKWKTVKAKETTKNGNPKDKSQMAKKHNKCPPEPETVTEKEPKRSCTWNGGSKATIYNQ